jgi:hypothetical protein
MSGHRCWILVAALVAAAGGHAGAAPRERPHPEDAKLPLWKGPLFCADAETAGAVWLAAICGNSAAACAANLERERKVLIEMMGDGTTFKACRKPDDDLQRLYCFREGSQDICSGKGMFCDEMREQSPAPEKDKGKECQRYRTW